jgi:hypothetical protein
MSICDKYIIFVECHLLSFMFFNSDPLNQIYEFTPKIETLVKTK